MVSSGTGSNSSDLIMTPGVINLIAKSNSGLSSGFVFDAGTDNFRFTDNRTTTKGLEYSDDYSPNFTDNSLVNKIYVDSVAAGLDPKESVAYTTTGTVSLSGILILTVWESVSLPFFSSFTFSIVTVYYI